jgi:hypothetical protein
LVIDQQAIMSLVVLYGLMPKADKSQFTDGPIRNASLEVRLVCCSESDDVIFFGPVDGHHRTSAAPLIDVTGVCRKLAPRRLRPPANGS